MGKNLPYEQLSVQLLAENVTQITCSVMSASLTVDNVPVNPVVSSTIRS